MASWPKAARAQGLTGGQNGPAAGARARRLFSRQISLGVVYSKQKKGKERFLFARFIAWRFEMKISLVKYAGTAVLASCLALQPIQASAAMVSTQDAATSQKIQADREKVRTFLDRATVKDKLQAMGVQAAVAKDRVDALSDSEVELLAQRIDSLPAGGNISNTELIIILLVVILVVVLI
jgi:hypothetical protein